MGLSKLTTSLAAAVAVLSSVPVVSADTFKLYSIYGPASGQQLVYKDDLAWIVTTDSADYESVTFTSSASGTIGSTFSANGTSFTNKLLYVPTEAGGQVGFTDVAAADQITDKFITYESYIYVDEGSTFDGVDFKAVSVSSGVWAVTWNGTTGSEIALLNRDPN